MFTRVKRPFKKAHRIAAAKLDLVAAWARSGVRPARVLFYPQRPGALHVIYRICHLLGYRISNDITASATLAIAWDVRTLHELNPDLTSLSEKLRVVNLRCTDISKRRIEAAHQAVLGYNLALDPRAYPGPLVVKSNDNARHDGRVVQGPIERMDEGLVYERLVDNRVDQRFVEDIRVPVFGDVIPLCYLKRRPITSRFSNANTSVSLASPANVLSPKEEDLIIQLCRSVGMDLGELDVLRDRSNGGLYAVDINPTPWGPPAGLSRRDARRALVTLTAAFAEHFPTQRD